MKKRLMTTLSIYIPRRKQALDPVGRLEKMGEKLDRSMNYLIVEAILQFLDREEGKQ